MIPSDERDEQPWLGKALRSGLFPLIIIVLLVYLASQTLLPAEDEADEIVYSDAKELIRESPETIERATFRPKGQTLQLTMADGRELETNYPGDASALALEELLDENGVQHDSRGTGDWASWPLLAYLLPFVVFFGFWILLMARFQQRKDGSGDGGPEGDIHSS